MSSIFTKIINRELPANIVYEDDLVIAFLDISQVTKGHTLVVPKVEYETIFDLPEDIAGHLYQVVVKLSKAINESLKPEGLNILNNNQAVAGQVVFHYHIHIIPRYDKEELTMSFPNNYGKDSPDELEKRVNLIRSAL